MYGPGCPSGLRLFRAQRRVIPCPPFPLPATVGPRVVKVRLDSSAPVPLPCPDGGTRSSRF
jgi:hypothetical protein